VSRPILDTDRPDPEALAKMRALTAEKPTTRWAAYQNVDLGHPELGHLQFLAIGPDVTFHAAPRRMPDTPTTINWRYWFCGWVNLTTGAINEGLPDAEPGPTEEAAL